MNTNIINTLIDKVNNDNFKLSDILTYLFDDKELSQKFVNYIRRSTVIGQIANEILQKTGSAEACKIMAIGDIEYFGEHKVEWEELIKNSLDNIDVSKLSGYDLASQGSIILRERLYHYMNNYYDFSFSDNSQIIDSIIPTYGGTDGFVSIVDTLKLLNFDKKINFIYPEASFMANISIVESILGKDNLIKLNKPSNDNFFFNQNQIEKLYKSGINKEDINIYYITPVGNPTGSKLDSNNLLNIVKKINLLDKKAIFIFDSVYVGLLKKEKSTFIFKRIFEDRDILNQIIFTESLSKTLGTTGIRTGWIWTLNKIYSHELKKNIILKKAGFSKILNEFGVNLLNREKELFDFQNGVYNFWNAQRLRFIEYINKDYSKYFDFDSSSQVLEREGIYVLLKVRNNYSQTEIFSNIGIIGVGINLSDGLYIRYAFGNVDYF